MNYFLGSVKYHLWYWDISLSTSDKMAMMIFEESGNSWKGVAVWVHLNIQSQSDLLPCVTIQVYRFCASQEIQNRLGHNLYMHGTHLVIVKDQYSHLVYPNIFTKFDLWNLGSIVVILKLQESNTRKKHPFCTNLCAFSSGLAEASSLVFSLIQKSSETTSFIKNYATSEGAISHNILYFTNYKLFYANIFCNWVIITKHVQGWISQRVKTSLISN